MEKKKNTTIDDLAITYDPTYGQVYLLDKLFDNAITVTLEEIELAVSLIRSSGIPNFAKED